MVRRKRFFSNHRLFQICAMPVIVVMCALVYLLGGYSPVHKSMVFNVSRGDTVTGVAARLEKDNIIDSAYLFKFAVRMHGGKIQSGQYDIPESVSVWRVAKMLSSGDVASVNIVIPEGLTIKQIKNLLLQSSELVGAVECELGNIAPVCDLKDGQIFPDTYRVAKGTKRLAVLELARKKMVAVEDSLKRSVRRLPKPLKDWNDVITLASIVQKETPKMKEMPIVASVYLNRLNKGMRLQADPTVVYVLTDKLGDMQGQPLLRGHLKIDSPYNTYRNKGLPPAPIANVGQGAIAAVLKPADTSFLFFVADGQGGHRFSRDYETHQKNHAQWREIKKNKL